MKRRLMIAGVSGFFICLIFVIMLLFENNSNEVKRTITFLSKDQLKVSADTYIKYRPDSTPMIVMFHQAGWSRGEYEETGPLFNQLGYNCMAVDLRSGNEIKSQINLTAKRARDLGKPTGYADTLQDIEAALKFARVKFKPTRIIALGSSYSASLVLKIAGDQPGLIDGVMAFSPREHFAKEGKTDTWIKDSAEKITVPVFIASARQEKIQWEGIFKAINTQTKFSFVPVTDGNHGSRALWSRFEESENYWRVVKTFLKSFF